MCTHTRRWFKIGRFFLPFKWNVIFDWLGWMANILIVNENIKVINNNETLWLKSCDACASVCNARIIHIPSRWPVNFHLLYIFGVLARSFRHSASISNVHSRTKWFSWLCIKICRIQNATQYNKYNAYLLSYMLSIPTDL